MERSVQEFIKELETHPEIKERFLNRMYEVIEGSPKEFIQKLEKHPESRQRAVSRMHEVMKEFGIVEQLVPSLHPEGEAERVGLAPTVTGQGGIPVVLVSRSDSKKNTTSIIIFTSRNRTSVVVGV